MSNYVKTTDFAAKDALAQGDPNKAGKGSEIDTEFNNIAVAVATKEDVANKNVAGGYAGLDGSGKIAASALSAAVASITATNTFTIVQKIQAPNGEQLRLGGAVGAQNPYLTFYHTDGVTRRGYIQGLEVGGMIIHSEATGSTLALQTNGGGPITMNGTNVTNASLFTAGSLAPGVVPASAVTQHQASLNIAASQVTSGTFADARIALTNVVQHQHLMKTRNISNRTGVEKTLSTSAPSGGSDGDIWYRYTPY
jgi:hypothetical protein